MPTLREHLLQAPDRHLDASMLPLIKGWMEPPYAIEVLEVLDHCAHSALASDFVIMVLNSLYDEALDREQKTNDDIVKLADWRSKFN